MADVKTLLKEARKLIDEKNFKEAQECCKNILRKDKENYLGLVLLGKSFQDADQAPLAFQKAIACKSDHPLAWQGLANYYERHNDTTIKIKLINTYSAILRLKIESEKALEILTKLGDLGISLKHQDCIGIFLEYISSNNLENELRETAETQTVKLLKCGIPCKQEEIPAIIKLLEEVHHKNPNEIELLHVKVIWQKKDFVSVVKEIITLTFFPSNPIIREWLCNQLCMKFVKENSFCGVNIEAYIDKITEGIQNLKAAVLLKSMIFYEKSQFEDAYKLCVPLVNYAHPDVTEATFIMRCTIVLKKWAVTQKLAINFLTKVNDIKLTTELKHFLFISLVKQHKWKQAVKVIKEIPQDSLGLPDQAMLAECYINLKDDATEILNKLKGTDFYIQLQALQLLLNGKYEETVALLANNIRGPLSLFYLGKAYWELKQYDKCQLNLLKAAKLDKEHADTFLYLGHFYRHNIKDLEKAKKCYEKAHNINSLNNDIAKNLSETYTELGLKKIDFELLNKLQNIETNESWINFRLGLHYLSKRDWENAIICFRNVIKQEHNNSTAFECLADAYYSRGSYTSALRAYHKVMELNPKQKIHCQTRIAYIHSLLTQHEDAIKVFEKVLDNNPNSILALKGIAETWMRIAKKKLQSKLFGASRECAQQTVNYISKALIEHKEYSCLWKILADALIFITKLPNNYAFVFINSSFNKKGSISDQLRKDKLELYPQAIASYSLIAKQKQLTTSFDLASAYLAFYRASNNNVNCNIAFNLTIESIKKKPNLWKNWDLLGKICWNVKKYNLAQHCFIKALLLTGKWSIAKIWCNLGTLYLKMKYYKIANYCYWRGQSTLPSYPQSWIGQGLIAEEIREEEAMDLFRHASRLGYHRESALGYAEWVCRTLKINTDKDIAEYNYIIESLYAVPYAIDLVEWCSCYEPENANACTLIGLLQERFGLLHSAHTSYKKALQYAPDDRKNIALLNLGRILLRLQKHEEAMITYKAITEASLDSACGLALSLFKNGLYEESYSAYDTALHWLSNTENEKAELLVAMAGIMYMFKGPDDAKTILFHSIQVSQKKPTAYSLFAICSLGLLHSDPSLSKLALSELQKYERDATFGFDIGFLKSYIFVCKNDVDKAIKILSCSLHDHPDNALLWYCMAQYCLKTSNCHARMASCSAQKALLSAHIIKGQSEPAKMLATASVAEQLAGNGAEALSLAKQGLHVYPYKAEMWAALLYSLLSNKSFAVKEGWLKSAATHISKHLEVSQPIRKWVELFELKLNV